MCVNGTVVLTGRRGHGPWRHGPTCCGLCGACPTRRCVRQHFCAQKSGSHYFISIATFPGKRSVSNFPFYLQDTDINHHRYRVIASWLSHPITARGCMLVRDHVRCMSALGTPVKG